MAKAFEQRDSVVIRFAARICLDEVLGFDRIPPRAWYLNATSTGA